jgi:N6-L-threonylcarbamoyladenine synthase
MIVLGIETSCDDTSVCLLEAGKIHFHKKFTQEELFKTWGGVVPELAARNHLQKITPLLQSAFDEARMKASDVDLIGVTTFPGLLGPLLTGLNAAKSLSLLHKTPILPVNHLFAHLEAIHLTESVSYPYLGVLLSGGHTLFFIVEATDNFKVIAHTIDDAAGEAFDKAGKVLGLGYPAGPEIDKLAAKGDVNKYKFPIGLRDSGDTRMSFSGIKTSMRTHFERRDRKIDDIEDVCASFQHAVIETILFKLKKAIEINSLKELPIVVGGGVACNSYLRTRLKEKYSDVHFVKPEFCTDNGAMIANYALLNSDKATNFPECLELDARSRYVQKGSNA